MRNVTIRKAKNPAMMSNEGHPAQDYGISEFDPKRAYSSMQPSSSQPQIQTQHGPSLLSEDEQNALKPRPVKVENPWIYEQTH